MPEEFSNLILDDTPINEITENDMNYLATFVNLEKLSMNACNLKSLGNLPASLKIDRVSENMLDLTVNFVDYSLS